MKERRLAPSPESPTTVKALAIKTFIYSIILLHPRPSDPAPSISSLRRLTLFCKCVSCPRWSVVVGKGFGGLFIFSPPTLVLLLSSSYSHGCSSTGTVCPLPTCSPPNDPFNPSRQCCSLLKCGCGLAGKLCDTVLHAHRKKQMNLGFTIPSRVAVVWGDVNLTADLPLLTQRVNAIL